MQFIDLAAQQARIRTRIDARIAAVLDHGHYILGPEVAELEARLAEFCGARHAITCANGTDALQLALMALGVGPGDAVFCPSFTFAATAEVVPGLGATPVFTDIAAGSYNMDTDSLRRAVDGARARGLRPAAVIPVDMFGLPADHDEIAAIAADQGMAVLDDAAQGFGGGYRGRVVGGIGSLATTSFFPAKPLGCYGDGGAVFASDDDQAALVRSLRVHGKGGDKYDNVRIGMNSRLDTLQAAILLEKLAIFPDEIEARQVVARRYQAGLGGRFAVPNPGNDRRSTWAQYTVACADAGERSRAATALRDAGVPSAVYYPMPLHRQTAYCDFPGDPRGLPVSEDLSARVLSLPMHPYLAPDAQDRVIETMLALPPA